MSDIPETIALVGFVGIFAKIVYFFHSAFAKKIRPNNKYQMRVLKCALNACTHARREWMCALASLVIAQHEHTQHWLFIPADYSVMIFVHVLSADFVQHLLTQQSIQS